MSKKLEFAERAVAPGAKLAPLCREYGITPPTGRKWRKRYQELGPAGLEERSRRPASSPLSFAEDLVAAVLEARDAHPTWGPKKLHVLLRRRFGDKAPSRSTVARMLRRFGRIQKRRARPLVNVVERAPNVTAANPNDVWTVDFKGWWKSHDGSRCEPLTVRDACSRFVLSVTLTRTTVEEVTAIFEALFRKYGLPAAIQCDNGCPFVHVRARAGLSRLSAWWVSVGIRLVRSRPGCPQDNGAHERMHRDIAVEVERVSAQSPAAQQRLLDKWRQEFNHVRPHEALDGKTPGHVYRPSERRHLATIVAVYPPHFVIKNVYRNGTIRFHRESYHISASLAGHTIGLEPLDELRWKVWFHHLDCGELEVLPEDLDDFVPQHVAPSVKRRERHDARQRVERFRTARLDPTKPGVPVPTSHPPAEPMVQSPMT
jgi:putative transposase